jgi:serine/threonine-protein kinase
VVGSVHYFSPEHAKGVHVSEQSDLYSLGVVLYQMVTGTLPFTGESPISVALMHIQNLFTDPRVINPLIPQSLENVILKSLRKRPEERYKTANEMFQDLENCLSSSRVNESKIVFSEDTDDIDQTRVIPAIKDELQFGPNGEILDIPKKIPFKREPKIDTIANTNQSEKNVDNGIIDDEEEERGWLKPTIWIATILVSLVIMWFGFQQIRSFFIIDEVTVPDVVSLSVDDAERKLRELKLIPKIEMVYDPEVDKDVVVSQKPIGTNVAINTIIYLDVSQGARIVAMENYVKNKVDAVKLVLERKYGISEENKNLKIEEKESDQPVGTIVEQSPIADADLEVGKTKVVLYVSKGLPTVLVPNLKGITKDEAVSRLLKSNLKVGAAGVIEQPNYTFDKGIVFEQSPLADTEVDKNSEVKIFVSSGYPNDTRVELVELVVSPATAGKTSDVKIVYSDARGDNIVWGTRTISQNTVFPVKIVMSPSKNGLIEIFRDQQMIDGREVFYNKGDEPLPTVDELLNEDSSSE